MYVCVCVLATNISILWLEAGLGIHVNALKFLILKEGEPYFDQADFKFKKVISLRLSGG